MNVGLKNNRAGQHSHHMWFDGFVSDSSFVFVFNCCFQHLSKEECKRRSPRPGLQVYPPVTMGVPRHLGNYLHRLLFNVVPFVVTAVVDFEGLFNVGAG